MEVYRPLVDHIVYAKVDNEFTIDEKRELLNIFNNKVVIKNRNQYLANSIKIYVDSMIKYMRKGKPSHLVFPTFNF